MRVTLGSQVRPFLYDSDRVKFTCMPLYMSGQQNNINIHMCIHRPLFKQKSIDDNKCHEHFAQKTRWIYALTFIFSESQVSLTSEGHGMPIKPLPSTLVSSIIGCSCKNNDNRLGGGFVSSSFTGKIRYAGLS